MVHVRNTITRNIPIANIVKIPDVWSNIYRSIWLKYGKTKGLKCIIYTAKQDCAVQFIKLLFMFSLVNENRREHEAMITRGLSYLSILAAFPNFHKAKVAMRQIINVQEK